MRIDFPAYERKRHEKTFAPPAYSTAAFMLCAPDAFRLLRRRQKGDNCLTNPAFSSCESAKADGWYFDSYRNAENAVFVKNAGPDGENALRLTLTELNDARLVQEVKCKRSTPVPLFRALPHRKHRNGCLGCGRKHIGYRRFYPFSGFERR